MKMRKEWVWMVIALIVVGCIRLGTLPQVDAPELVQPLTVDELYGGVPVVVPDAPRTRAPLTGATPADARLIQDGRILYLSNCAPCHRPNGEGNLNRFPALAHNAFVTNQAPDPLIRTVLYGRGVMPAFAPTLDAQELAAILSYVRTSWSNDAPIVRPADVRDVLQQEREQPRSESSPGAPQ